MRIKFKSSLRIKLLCTFFGCIIATLIFSNVITAMRLNSSVRKQNSYRDSILEVQGYNQDLVEYVSSHLGSLHSRNFASRIENYTKFYGIDLYNLNYFIVDSQRKVILKSPRISDDKVRKMFQSNPLERNLKTKGESYNMSVFPVSYKGSRIYIVTSSKPQRTETETSGNGFGRICSVIFFLVLYFSITNIKLKYIKELVEGLKKISEAKLDYRVKVRGRDELASLATSINLMTEQLKDNIERENRAERTKAELITSMSHDLRTPLTSVLGYLRLVVDRKYENEEEKDKYIHRAYAKSEKLKVLIDDLFEYTKSSSPEIPLNLQKVCINELLIQVMEDYAELAKENDIMMLKEISNERMIADIDSVKFVRVIENLLVNAIRYGYKPSSITVKLFRGENGRIVIGVQNYGEAISGEDMNRLFEKFYRIEKSRSSDAGGSGLGLAIAYNIVKLHGGRIWVEQADEVICFYVEI